MKLQPSDSTVLARVPPVMFPRTLGSGEQLGALVPHTPRQVLAMGPDGVLWTGVGDVYRLVGVNVRGDTLHQIELTARQAPLTRAEQAEVEAEASGAHAKGFAVDRSVLPARHPYFTSVEVADDRHLWVRRPAEDHSERSDRTRGAVYDIIAPDGRYQGSVPAPFVETPGPHIARRYVVGVMRDSLDVPYVGVYRVVRPDSASGREAR